MMAPKSTMSPDGIRGLNRGSRNRSASASAPTRNVTQLASGSSRMMPTSFSSVLPSGLGTPNSLFSCPTATNMARPTTKPSITGLLKNWVMKPKRAIPATRNTSPVTSTKAAAYAWYESGSPVLAAVATSVAATDDASSAAVADVAPTWRWRDVPSNA